MHLIAFVDVESDFLISSLFVDLSCFYCVVPCFFVLFGALFFLF